ncbi:Chemotaxis protein CheY [Bdellovibrio bacteriovorus]|uniref:response regulator n=1 Tax=Bdellovibrio bacteriovorus TaxID=959 RepID=UPI00045BEF0F|nr:response regulator [Bdellovibrio bacteriovorus]AHZ85153.1 membrane protein [Bdellovibrio bacteriovorus]BEV69043.1 Chemotaxis protein CheY [Bdellovibrio bacteriovorus]
MKPLHVLVAEDNTVNQLIVRGMLVKLGHNITMVENGKRAVAELQVTAFDLILMDCHMPEMDGFLATQTIRANPKFKALPIIAMTASEIAEDKDRCVQVGMTDFLAKPLTMATLEAVLRKYSKE